MDLDSKPLDYREEYNKLADQEHTIIDPELEHKGDILDKAGFFMHYLYNKRARAIVVLFRFVVRIRYISLLISCI